MPTQITGFVLNAQEMAEQAAHHAEMAANGTSTHLATVSIAEALVSIADSLLYIREHLVNSNLCVELLNPGPYLHSVDKRL